MEWEQSERPEGLDNFPLSAVPYERRTSLAYTAASLYAQEAISRDALAESLGVTPVEPLEEVLDFFSIDLPLQ